MIKINLIKKEVRVQRDSSRVVSIEKIQFSVLNHPILKKWFYFLVLGYGAFYGLDQYKENELNKLQQVLDDKKNQLSKIQHKMDSTREFDTMKNTMDNNEKSVRIKLETIKNLMAKKNIVLNAMLFVSNTIPKNVWLDTITLKENDFIIQGDSLDFKFIAEFVKQMKKDAFFSNLELVEAQKKIKNIHFVMVSSKK